MRHFIYVVAASAIIVSAPLTSTAQLGAIEIGVKAGVATNTNPTDNMAYKGNRFTVNPTVALTGLYNIHRSMAAGIEVRSVGLARKSDQVYITPGGTLIGGDDKRIAYSNAALSVVALFNGKLNTYRGYLYGGLAAGYGFSVHDQGRAGSNESYRAPNGGSGLAWGIQAGYTHGLSKILGLNIEAALRNYTLNYNAPAPAVVPPADLGYNITAYSVTIGLKVRIMPKHKTQNYIPPMRGQGKSR